MEDRFAYGLNPKKIGAVSAYLCDPASAPAEFLLTKSQYQAETGRAVERGALFFQIRQAFPPGEVTPEEANKIGYERPCAGQRASTSFSFVPTSTRATFIITFITTPRPRTAPGSFITSSAPALRCGGSLTGCALSMSCLLSKSETAQQEPLSPLWPVDRGKATHRTTAGTAGHRGGPGEKASRLPGVPAAHG